MRGGFVMSTKNGNTKNFTDFEKFMDYVKGVDYDEEVAGFFGSSAENHNGYLAVVACGDTVDAAKKFAKKIKGQVITYRIEDGDDGTSFTYETGIGLVNRELFLFCHSNKDAFCEEYEEYTDEQLEEMHE